MNGLQGDILRCIGNTSLLALRNIVPPNGARILLKVESENPTGSMEDRMAPGHDRGGRGGRTSCRRRFRGRVHGGSMKSLRAYGAVFERAAGEAHAPAER
jgi:hypothetical protein